MSASGTLPADWLSDTVSQPDSRAAGGVWDCPSVACCSVAPQSPRATGRRRERTHDSHPAFIPLPLRRTGRTGSQDRFRGSADRAGIPGERRMPAYWRRGRDRTRDGHCDCGRHQRWPRFSEWKAVCCLGGGLVPRQHPAEAKQNCWVSANAVIPICTRLFHTSLSSRPLQPGWVHICPSSSTSRRLTTAHGWEWLVIVFVTLNQKNTQLVA